jgi:hypothetical protein
LGENALANRGACRDPECHCRKIEAPIQGCIKGRHFEAWLIIQAVSWYLRYPLSYRNIEEMVLERGFEVDHISPNISWDRVNISKMSASADKPSR